MDRKIRKLIEEIRSKAVGKTCMGMGNFALDVFFKREYPNGFNIGYRNQFSMKSVPAMMWEIPVAM